VISDAHPGLVDAIRSTLAGAVWQRCRTHFMRNLLTRVPRSAQAMVATLVRTIFAQPDAASVWEQHAKVVEQLTERFPAAAELLAEAGPDVLASPRSPKSIGARSGRTTPKNGSTRNYAGAPMSWASSPTATR
jgi:putative transposase